LARLATRWRASTAGREPLAAALLKPVNRLARGLGYRGREIGGALPFSRANFKRRMLIEAAAGSRPRWILVIRAHEFVDAELVRALKRDCGVEKVIGWRVDGPLDTPDRTSSCQRGRISSSG